MASNIIQNLRKKDIEYKNRIYTLAYLAIFLKAFCLYSELITGTAAFLVRDIGNMAFLCLLVYKIVFLQSYSIKQIAILGVIGVACLYTDITLGMFMFIQDFLLLIATQDVDFKGVIKKIYRLSAVLVSIHLIAYAILWNFNRSSLRFSIRLEETGPKVRHQILLAHANIASMIIFWTLLGYLYVEYDKLNKKKIICAWMIYIGIYQLTDSNSGLIILSIVCAVLLLKNLFGNAVDSVITFLARYLFIILAIFSNFLMVIYTSTSGVTRDIWNSINGFFTGRLIYGVYAYDNYGFTLLGQVFYNKKDYWRGMWIDSIPCDNAYLWMSVGYGITYTFIMAFIIWKYSKYAKFEEKLMVIAYSLYMMMELYVTYFYLVFSLIILMKYFWSASQNGKKLIGATNEIRR